MFKYFFTLSILFVCYLIISQNSFLDKRYSRPDTEICEEIYDLGCTAQSTNPTLNTMYILLNIYLPTICMLYSVLYTYTIPN